MKRFTQLVACVMCSLMMSAGPDQPMNLGARAVTAAPLAEGSEPSRVDATQGLAALDQRALFVQTVGQIGGGSHSVDVEGTHACLTMGPRLLILDVSNPSAPRQEGQTDAFPHQLSNVFFKDGYCYVTDWDVLRIIDVIDPSEPRVVGTYDSPGSPIDVQVVGKYAYVAALGEGLRIVDVTDPKQPKEVGFYKGGAGSAGAVKVVGQHAYVAYRSAGLKIVDV
jgi:hypothetical protein